MNNYLCYVNFRIISFVQCSYYSYSCNCLPLPNNQNSTVYSLTGKIEQKVECCLSTGNCSCECLYVSMMFYQIFNQESDSSLGQQVHASAHLDNFGYCNNNLNMHLLVDFSFGFLFVSCICCISS